MSETTKKYDLTVKRDTYKTHFIDEICFIDIDADEIIVDRLKNDEYVTSVVKRGDAVESGAVKEFYWHTNLYQ
jgi:hypothetical protein